MDQRVALYSNKDYEAYPHEWSSDGKHIAAFFFSNKDKSHQIMWVSVADGSVRVLKTMVKGHGTGDCVCHSPDDRYIAYNLPVEEDSGNYDISLLATDGSGEIPLVEHPANDRLLGWVPNRDEILFTSDRTGTHDVWAIKVVNGKVQGSPRPITRDIGQIQPQGFTQDGSFYFNRYTRRFTTHVVPFDADTGQIQEESKRPLLGSNFYPEWSPNGESLAYVTEKEDERRLHIRNLRTGEERELASDIGVRAPRWSPDGRFIVFPGFDHNRLDQKDYRGGIYKIDVRDDHVTQLVQFAPDRRVGWRRSTSEWSLDGKAVFYLSPSGIVRRELDSGQEKQLYQSDDLARALDLSPDGKKLAFGTEVPREGTASIASILVIAVSGGEPTELCKFQESKGGITVPRHVTWTLDGNYVLFAKSEEKGSTVWRISSDGGDPELIWTCKDRVTSLSVHPNGKEIAVSTYIQEFTIWVMENFLPTMPAAKPTRHITLRQVLAGSDADNCIAVSPDGRYFSYVDYGDSGDLAIYEIATGKKRRLTNQANKGYLTPMECAFYPRWSPDGKQIAYCWWREDEFINLRIIGLDGSKPRILYSDKEVGWIHTYDWSPDGKQILACFGRKDGPEQIVLVSVADGSVRIMKTFEKHSPGNMYFSPGGSYIVYDFPQKEDSIEHDIYLLSTDGSREISLVRHPADDYVLGWAPDGKNILFASDRTVTLSAWLIAVADGKPQGAPELVKPDIIRRFDPLGFTRDGSFYYNYGGGNIARRGKKQDIYIAKLDPETGKILIPPKKAIKRFEGFNRAPIYSPDGKYLAYVSSRRTMPFISPSAQPNVLCIRSLETGQERVLLPKLKNFASGCWSLDCRSFRVRGLDNKDRRGIFQIDAQTGDVITSVMISDEHKGVYSCQWSRDGKTLFYVSNDVKAELAQIFIRDLETGIEKVLYRAPIKETLRFAISPSPDGNWLAFINFDVFGFYNTTRRGKRVLKIMPAAGGEPRELYTFVHNWNNRPIPITWTADGKYILFLREKSNKDDPKWELCRISAEGGEPQKLGLEVTRSGFYSPSVHPDGQHIAFQSTTRALAEVWVMENFLPAEGK